MSETIDDYLTALFNSTGWILACAQQDRQKQYELIRGVIDTEREACAQVAESFIPSGFTSDGKAGDTYAVARDDRARTIAAAIRARGNEDTP